MRATLSRCRRGVDRKARRFWHLTDAPRAQNHGHALQNKHQPLDTRDHGAALHYVHPVSGYRIELRHSPRPIIFIQLKEKLMPEPRREWSDCLSNRGGRLFMEECDVVEAAATSSARRCSWSRETQLRNNVAGIPVCFQKYWPMARGGSACLQGQLESRPRRIPQRRRGRRRHLLTRRTPDGALAGDTPPQRISVNGGGKSAATIRRCIRSRRSITVEDPTSLN